MALDYLSRFTIVDLNVNTAISKQAAENTHPQLDL